MKLAARYLTLGLTAMAFGLTCGSVAGALGDSPPGLAGTLEQSVDGAAYREAGGSLHKLTPDTCVPYRLISLGPPLLLTAISSDLLPKTYAGQDSFCTYPGYLPVLAAPPVVALKPAGAGGGDSLLLLRADGTVGMDLPGAELLVPAAGEPGATALVILPGAAADDVWTLGYHPRICAINCKTMQELWRIEYGGELPVAGAELVAICQAGIVAALQHDYEHYSLLVISKAGRLLSSTPLAGQPAVNLVWPGPLAELAQVSIDGSTVELGVNFSEGGSGTLQFDLRSGAVTDTGRTPLTRPQRDERSPFGAGAERVVWQGLVPREAEPPWSIPALVDDQRRVLVIVGDRPEWVKYSP